MAEDICEVIATTYLGMEDVLDKLRESNPATPSLATVYRWLASSDEFREKSARARELQGDSIIDLALKEAYNSRVGVITTVKESGTEIKRADNVERSKLIVQTLLKRAGQLAPKKYGDKLDMNLSGKDGGPIQAAIAVTFVRTNGSDQG
jgi:hypothetical protein